jgi:putative transposase
MPSPVSPEWLSPKALAGRWCLVRSTAYDLIARGHLPFYQLGGSIRVKWADVWANKEAGYQYSPQLGEAFHRRKRAVWISWRMDETYIWVKVQWRYLYRAVDKHGQTIDFLLTEQRDERTATRFLTKAIRRHGVPETITINGSEANAAAIKRYNEEHRTAIIIRQVKYLNNMVEQNHRSVKRITRPELGFNSFAAVQDTMVGIELMCIIEQRQMVVEKGGKGLTTAEQFYSLAP